MAETQSRTNSKDVGVVKDSSLRAQQDLGVSNVQGVNLKINQAEFFSELDALANISRTGEGCSVGKFMATLDEATHKKLSEVFLNEKVNSARLVELLDKYGVTINPDVMRRHRRRMAGKMGCKCQRES